MKKVRCHLIIKGRVQGVFFRVSTREQARHWKVKGWVANTYSGDVEAVFEGEESAVDQLVRWCRKGPPGAHVRDVEIHPEPYTGEFSNFSIRHGYS
jgi:acylphosphatase